MARSTLLIALASLLIKSLYADSTDQSIPDLVVVLGNDNFTEYINSHPLVLVEFYAPWCGHCKSLAPEYLQAAYSVNATYPNVTLAKLDAVEHTTIAEKYAIKGYPTLKPFRNGVVEEYGGGRTAQAIVAWVKKWVEPALVEVVTLAAAVVLAKNESVAFLGQFKSKDQEAYKSYKAVAESNRLLGTYLTTIHADAKDEVTVYKKGEEPLVHKVVTKDALADFVKKEHFPLFGPITGDNFGDYFALEKEMVWFIGDEAASVTAAATMQKAALKYKNECSFVWLDSEKFGSHAENALGVSKFPGLVYQSKKGRYVYPAQDFTATDAIINFFADAMAGKIEKNLKSEPIPEKQDQPVKVVVGKNFEKVVLDPSKDVLLEVYAPWCGHCKQLEKIYTELAESVAKNEHLVIAKMDGTANESPVEGFDWTGFPTIFFVKAGEKTPTKYSGGRTLEAFKKFLTENSSKPVVLAPETAKPAATETRDEL